MHEYQLYRHQIMPHIEAIKHLGHKLLLLLLLANGDIQPSTALSPSGLTTS